MLHSKYHNKNTYEDPKTSAIFENLILLPDNVFWHLFRASCFDSHRLPIHSGKLLSYNFWPHWDKTGTNNTNFIEPDLFLQFENFDVIIEAKYGDLGGQCDYQWKQEIVAYSNEYGFDKPFLFIAIGGNMSTHTENIKVKGKDVLIYKCNWLSLLISVNKYSKELDGITIPDYNLFATQRLLDNIVLAFNVNGVYNIKWFNTMEQQHTIISPSSIDGFSTYFNMQ